MGDAFLAAVSPTAGLQPRQGGDADQAASSLVVADYTELWDLADSAYGDGVNWKLIAQANAGFVDARGALITDATEAVAPGTELRMPGAIDLDAVGQYGTVRGEAVHVVEPGDSMWTVAEQVVESDLNRRATTAEVADYWSHVVEANADVASGDIDLIHPGDELVLPGAAPAADEAPGLDARDESSTAAPGDGKPSVAADLLAELNAGESDVRATDDESPGAELVADVPVGQNSSESAANLTVEAPLDISGSRSEGGSIGSASPAAAIASSSATPGRTAEVDEPVAQRSAVVALGLASLGAAMLAAGVSGAIRRRRDLQRRTRAPASIARRASAASEGFEAALRQSSHQVSESQLGLGWRMIPAPSVVACRQAGPLQINCDDSGRLRAVPLASHLHDADTDADNDAATGHDHITLDALEFDTSEAPLALAPVPTSLLIGTDSATGEAVFFDLESTGSLSLVGGQAAVQRFARGAVLDLAVSDRADDLCLIAIDIAAELEPLERVHIADSFADAVAHAVRTGHGAPDSTTSVVVVSTIEPDENDASIAALRDLNAVLVAPNLCGQARLVIDGKDATLLPSGAAVELAAYADHDYRAVAELVETTSITAMEPSDQQAVLEQVVDVVPAARCDVDAGPVEVRILGPVEVAGADSFSSLKAIDVVAFLAFHRNGADGDQIKSWVWPAYSPPTDKAFANVMSRARTGLGAGEDGSPFLSRAGSDRIYRLSTVVTTDFDRFRAIVELADAATDDIETVAILKQALELIRGVPFTGGGASSFAWADNHVRANVEFTIDETVHRCADLALEVGDLETARWTALKGLELVPGCEQCFRRRFLVAGAGNNRTELRRAMADLERVAAAELGEPEAIDHISGDLLELYHQVDQALLAGPR